MMHVGDPRINGEGGGGGQNDCQVGAKNRGSSSGKGDNEQFRILVEGSI